MDPQTHTMPIRTPHEALGRNFPPTAPWGVPSGNPAGFARNRPKTRGTAFRAPGGNAHESVGRTVRPTAPWGVPSSYAFFTRIGAPRLQIPRVLPRCRRKATRNAPGGPRGSHERHPPPQAGTGHRKHRKNVYFLEFAHRIPCFLRGHRKPVRKGHGKTRHFATASSVSSSKYGVSRFPNAKIAISSRKYSEKVAFCHAKTQTSFQLRM